MKRAFVALTAVAALVAAGCGSGSSGSAGDPAKLAPAGTIAYASLELAPQGPEKQGFDAAFGKLLGPDPESKLAQALTDALKEQGSKLDYATDVKPWLGDTAAAVLTGVSQNHADYAVLLASTDDDKARAAIDKDLAGTGARSESYRGDDYKLMSDGTANGVVDHYLVAGTEAAFKAIVDADKDGKSLADSQAWHDSVGDRASGKVGLGFVDLKALIAGALSSAPGAARLLAPLGLAMVQIHPFVATLDADTDGFVLDVSSPGAPAKGAAPALSSPLIETVPGDSWAAFALPHVGQFAQKLVSALKLNPLIGKSYAQFAARISRISGLDLERDVLAGVGDVAGFVRGRSASTVEGGAVIAAADRAALRRTLAGLPRLIAKTHSLRASRAAAGFDLTGGRLERPVQVRPGGPGAVLVYGSAHRALAPPTRLGASSAYRLAAARVGARPTLFVAIPPLLDVVRSSPHRSDKLTPEQEAHLRHLDYFALGVRRAGGTDLVRAVLGLR